MFKRFLSHLLISLAVFVLTATFFMWTVDGRVLEPGILSGELRKAGVSQEFSNLLPQIITTDSDSSPIEKAEMAQKVSQAITARYVDQKIGQITDSILTFVKAGEPQPVIDLSDFPNQLQNAGVEVGDEINDKFDEPIKLNENGAMDKVTDAYRIFGYIKYAGIALFLAVLLLEWYISERGKKLRRISRIFLYSGASYLIYWGLLVGAPGRLATTLQKNVQAEYDTTALIDAIMKAFRGLFAGYFLSFAVVCLGVTVVLYIIRHYKHGDVALATPNASTTSKR